MICRRAQPLPVEVIVRGYLSGSGWKDYGRTGAVCGIPLPAGLRESDRLPEPLFTPSTKAEVGHDENIDFDEVGAAGRRTGRRADPQIALDALPLRGRRCAETRGIILADTKFELGLLDGPSGRSLILIDEVHDARLEPLLGRRRPTSRAGGQASFDKQFVRDWLETLDWDKTAARAVAARRGRGRHACPLRRGVRADHRWLVRRPTWRRT